MRRLRDMGEFGLIERLGRIVPTSPLVVEGIGDDCAVVRFGDKLLLATMDMFVENVHFRRDWSPASAIGWKAAAASLSDIAAMGGAPLFGLTSLSCSADTPAAMVEEIYQGMSGALSRFGAVLIGGDTVCAGPDIVLDVVLLGETAGNRCVSRHGAEDGDRIVVTGTCGHSSAGHHALQHGNDAPELVQAHLHPMPRISEGQWLCRRGDVHAMIDVSDGLLQDLGHIAACSNLGIDVSSESLPVSPALTRYCSDHDCKAEDFIFRGGEDYELAFAVAAFGADALLDAFHHEFHIETTTIGVVTDRWLGIRVDGVQVDSTGFDHFKNAR